MFCFVVSRKEGRESESQSKRDTRLFRRSESTSESQKGMSVKYDIKNVQPMIEPEAKSLVDLIVFFT